jgi:hypothetical protein
MVYQGTIQNGVVVFSNGIHPPEGSLVHVKLASEGGDSSILSPDDDALLRMSELAIDTGIPDLAVNVDHYLYGHPKVTDDR